MDKNTSSTVSYWVYESCMARAERQIKRMWIAIIIAFAVLFASNAAWLWYLSLYDFSGTYEEIIIEATQDGEGINIVGAGDIDYGAESQNN